MDGGGGFQGVCGPGAYATTTVPVMFGWGSQWYGNVPFWVNLKLNHPPGSSSGEANTPVSLVTVCWFVSPLYHRTVVLTLTVRVPGAYGVGAFIALGTMWTSAPCPPFTRRFVIRGDAAVPTSTAPMANPRTANVRSPPPEWGDAR